MRVFKFKKYLSTIWKHLRLNHLKKGVICENIWYGSEYGGFYVYPFPLNEDSIVYSFGLGTDISFDKMMYEKHKCHIYAFDPTPKSINWISNQNLFEKFHFYNYGISNKSGFVDFYLPKNPNYISGSICNFSHLDSHEKIMVRMKTIKEIMSELHHNHIDLLKIDIEGHEYEVVDDILLSDISVNQILIEFHARFEKNGYYKRKRI
jgi:FkbM family methyltransferase